MSFCCERLRQNFPSPESLLGTGKAVVHAWAHGLNSIDYSERSHAQTRIGLHSSGRAKSFTTAANRLLCQQARAEMEERLGQDPAKLISPVSAITDDEASAGPQGSQTLHRKRGLNPYLCWKNEKLAAHKLLRASGRKLSQQELSEFNQACKKEWDEMTDEETAPWQQVHRGFLAASADALIPVPAPEAKASFQPPWGLPSKWCKQGCLVPPDEVLLYYRSRPYQQRESEAFDDPSLLVVEAAACPHQKRTSSEKLFGCWANKKNVCRATLGREVAQRVDLIATTLNKIVDKVGLEVVKNVEVLLRCHLPKAEGRPASIDSVVWLADARSRPKMQFLLRCVLRGGDSSVLFQCPRRYPYDLDVSVRATRISPTFKAVDVCTSDELSLQLAKLGGGWTFSQLQWEEIPDSSLRVVRVVGEEEKFVAVMKKKKNAAARKGESNCADEDLLPAEMFAACPWELGRKEGEAMRGGLGPQGGDACAGLVEEQGGAASDVEEECNSDGFDEAGEARDGIPPMERHDLAEVALDMLGGDIDEELLAAVCGGCPSAVGAAAEGGESSDEGEVEAALVAACGEDGNGEADARTAVEKAAGANVDCLGYISHPDSLEFNIDKVLIGRITTWPREEPLLRRSVSIKCWMHPGCGSPARKRHQVDDALLLQWFFQGSSKLVPAVSGCKSCPRCIVLPGPG